ncbi:MAG: hypothetical protein WBM02_09140 [bacterium]
MRCVLQSLIVLLLVSVSNLLIIETGSSMSECLSQQDTLSCPGNEVIIAHEKEYSSCLFQPRIALDQIGLRADMRRNLEYLQPQLCGNRSGTVTWSYEDWDGNYGAIASSIAVPADGSRVYVGWYLNYERFSAFNAQGNGVPIWEFDLLESNQYYVESDVQMAVSDDGSVLVGAVTGRKRLGENAEESFVLGLDIDSGAELWRYTTPVTGENPEKGERIGVITLSSDGSRVAVVSYGYRSNPIYEPIFITILDGSGQELHRIVLPDPDGHIYYLSDMKLNYDGSLLAADFRMAQNPEHLVMVWNMDDYSVRDSWTIMNSPPQSEIGFSDDGSILAVGDLHGRLRVYEWQNTTSRAQYTEKWSYTIPPDYYYPWVVGLDVSRDGTKVAMGSYQSNQASVISGHIYLFDTESGPSSLIKSTNMGGMVVTVRFSADGSVVAGAGYGPRPETAPGYDMIVIETETGNEIYRMPGNTPGSLLACAINSNGTRIGAGGKRVHANEFGSGGFAYSIELTTEPEPTPQPTNTPSSTPTATPSPIPTATPTQTNTPTRTPTPTLPPTQTPIPTHTPAPPTQTPTPKPTFTPTPKPTFTPSHTPAPTNTPEPTITPTSTYTSEPATTTPEPTKTATPTNTPESTPSPTQTSEPTNTPEPTYTAAPTHTPQPTDTPEPTITPTPPCGVLGCRIEMPSKQFKTGDPCYCNVVICNPKEDVFNEVPIFVILDVYGLLFFAPEFNDFSYLLEDIYPGETTYSIIPLFSWPENAGQASGLYFYAGMTNRLVTELFGEIDIWEFGWE